MTARKSRKTTAGSVFNASVYPATQASRDAACKAVVRGMISPDPIFGTGCDEFDFPVSSGKVFMPSKHGN
jgi:hypothetical protein